MVKKMYNTNYIDKLKQACEMIYTDICDIYTDVTKINHETLTSYNELKLVYENVKCRVSYRSGSGGYSIGSINFNETLYSINKNVKFFMQNDLEINVGDNIYVTKSGINYKYVVNSIPNVFSSHQEFFAQIPQLPMKHKQTRG